MILLPRELRATLRANDVARHSTEGGNERYDPCPVVKFFNPIGAATWLATELADDGNTLFGLADAGLGCPELRSFSLSEIRGIRLPYGLWIERDIRFRTPFTLSRWADTARRVGSILWAETLLLRAVLNNPNTHFPPPE
jgi:hypothetical protein